MRMSEMVIEIGLKCRECGKKYLGRYDIESFGECGKCNSQNWEPIVHNGKNYTSNLLAVQVHIFKKELNEQEGVHI